MKNLCAAVLASAVFTVPALANPEGPITVIAHVDLLPTYLAQGLPALEQFAQQSRTDPGVLSFTLITWAPTNNHFQLVEVYDSLQSFDNHVQAAHTITFRAALQPLIGAPYDERRYAPFALD